MEGSFHSLTGPPGAPSGDAVAVGEIWPDRARVLLLGLNAWATLTLLPAVLAGLVSAPRAAWLAVPLLPLGAGVALLGTARIAARWVLLGAFPAVTAGLVAGLPAIARPLPDGALTSAIGALSLVVYGAAAAYAVGKPEGTRAAQLRPLGSVSPAEEHTLRRRLRSVVLAITAAGAFGLVLVAPTLGGSAAYEAWGDAAGDASVLATVVGTVLATVVATLFVGPALRASRTPPPSTRRVRRRVIALLITFTVGLAVYLVYAFAG